MCVFERKRVCVCVEETVTFSSVKECVCVCVREKESVNVVGVYENVVDDSNDWLSI